ncbi:hypothetical protein PoB_006036100 [Plakobranchus ocellatus]|uniref:Uncharacterized protein n=1 Tax=Plakobranchus ocellatus TaxID=259542 RepID=A0AAV4CPW3_9GAST|nr:hypothetical protein PoB_006036100 [Plakobranchus ocellatus]
MALIKQNTDVDLPHQWHQVFSEARVKPSPFHVIPCTQTMFLTYTDHLKPAYRATCPLKTRPIRELFIYAELPQLVSFRNSWNGAMETAVVVSRQQRQKSQPLKQSFTAPIPISKEKFKDLQCLKKLCSPANQEFYASPSVLDTVDGDSAQSESEYDE